MADASNAAAEELAEAEATSNGVGPSAKRVDRVKVRICRLAVESG